MKNKSTRSLSSEKTRIVIPKLLPISSVSTFGHLNNTFHTTQTLHVSAQKPEPSTKPDHKRFFSTTSHINFAKSPFFNFSGTKERSTNFDSRGASGKSQKSRPVSSIFGSFHADKTQQDFLKHQNDPLFRDFTSLVSKSRPGTTNPFEDVVCDFKEKKQKKQREMIFYLRKMTYAKILMKDLVSEFKKFDNSPQNEKEIYLGHIKENWSDSLQVFRSIASILQCLTMNAMDRDAINKTLNSLMVESQNLRVYQLNLLCLIFSAKCCIITKDYFRAISLFKQAKSLAHAYSNNRIKLKCYKGLGTCFQILKKYALAKHYFIRVLQLCWLTNDKQNELLAYDSIGLQHYYLGDVEQAQYFHFKMMKGEYESEDSALRALGIKKIGLYKENKRIKNNLRKEGSNSEIPENPLFCVSSEDDDFEIIVPRDQLAKNLSGFNLRSEKGEYSRANEFRQNPNNSNCMREIIAKQANSNIRYKTMMQANVNKIWKLDHVKTQKHMVSAKFLQNNPQINSKILLSHLTPNKSVNFFHNSILRGNEGDLEQDSNQIFNKLDGRSVNKIVKKAKYFNANIQFTIKNVATILECVGLGSD